MMNTSSPTRLLRKLALHAALAACTAAWAAPHAGGDKGTASSPTTPHIPEQVQAAQRFGTVFDTLLGELHATRQEYGRAFGYLMRAAETSTDTRLYARAAKVALQGQAPDAALRAIAAWEKAAPQDAEASFLELQVLVALDKWAQTPPVLEHMLHHATAARRSALIHTLPMVYARTDSADIRRQAEQILRAALKPYATMPETAFITALALARMDILDKRYASAMAALEHTQTVTADPHHVGAALPNRELPAIIALDVLRQTSGSAPELAARAERLIRQQISQPDASGELQFSFAQNLLTLQRLDDGHAVLQQLIQREPNNSIALLLQAAIDMERKQFDQAEIKLHHYLSLRERPADSSTIVDEDATPDGTVGDQRLAQQIQQGRNARGDVQAYRLLTAIADLRQQYEVGNQWVMRIHPPSLRHTTMRERVSTLGAQKQYAAALQLAQALPQDTPERIAEVALLQSSLYEKSGHIQQAIDTISAALVRYRAASSTAAPSRSNKSARKTTHKTAHKSTRTTARQQHNATATTGDSALEVELRYVRGYLYGQAGHITQAERDLRYTIAQRPQSAQGYNALGYLLADRGERLNEAHQLISQAIQLAPDNGAIMDSMGWVLYRMGQTEEAVRWLQRALAAEPQAEITAHYGEVLWVLGQRAKARAIWQAGLRLDSSDSTLLQTIQRFAGGLDDVSQSTPRTAAPPSAPPADSTVPAATTPDAIE